MKDEKVTLRENVTIPEEQVSSYTVHRPALSRVSSSTFFTEDDGGVASVNDDGREGNQVYYLGIIDILQVYNNFKRLEFGFKALTINAASVSVAPPRYYAERFLKAITSRLKGVDDHWEDVYSPRKNR